jgi:hypothetical protein
MDTSLRWKFSLAECLFIHVGFELRISNILFEMNWASIYHNIITLSMHQHPLFPAILSIPPNRNTEITVILYSVKPLRWFHSDAVRVWQDKRKRVTAKGISPTLCLPSDLTLGELCSFHKLSVFLSFFILICDQQNRLLAFKIMRLLFGLFHKPEEWQAK